MRVRIERWLICLLILVRSELLTPRFTKSCGFLCISHRLFCNFDSDGRTLWHESSDSCAWAAFYIEGALKPSWSDRLLLFMHVRISRHAVYTVFNSWQLIGIYGRGNGVNLYLASIRFSVCRECEVERPYGGQQSGFHTKKLQLVDVHFADTAICASFTAPHH